MGDMVLSFVTALGMYVTIEAPFRKVFRELLMPSKKHHVVSPERPTSETDTSNQNCDSRL